MSVKPFVGASAPRRTLGPDAFLAPPPAATPGRKSGGDGGDASSGEAGGEARSKSQLPAWRAGGPPKKVRCYEPRATTRLRSCLQRAAIASDFGEPSTCCICSAAAVPCPLAHTSHTHTHT